MAQVSSGKLQHRLQKPDLFRREKNYDSFEKITPFVTVLYFPIEE